jgi:hypothetical protein
MACTGTALLLEALCSMEGVVHLCSCPLYKELNIKGHKSKILCVRLESNIIALHQVTSLIISSPVVGLLPLASGQAFLFPQRPLKRLLDDMTAKTETGHPGLNS